MFRETSKSSFLGTIIIAFSLVLMGYFVRVGLEKFRTRGHHSVKVKGLSERQVKSDFAIWDLSFRSTGANFQEARQGFAKSRASVLAFLKERGFQDSETSESAPQSSILHRKVKEEEVQEYVFSGTVSVKTARVDHVARYVGDVSKLLEQGVMLGDSDPWRRSGGVKYLIQDFDSVRPEMLKEATKSARTMADQFAEHSDTKVGRILHADQGNFSISSTEGEYDSHKTLMKKIRVVSYLTYALEG